MGFLRIYTITCVNSAGFENGRESFSWQGLSPEEAIRGAYGHYTKSFRAAKQENLLDDSTDTPLSRKEFELLMKSGFAGGDDTALILCTGSHMQYEASSVPLRDEPSSAQETEEPALPTNREYLVRSLIDPDWIDDGGASYDSWLHYNISCPYFSGDKRAHCTGKPDEYICWENCNICKEEWLDKEVDV